MGGSSNQQEKLPHATSAQSKQESGEEKSPIAKGFAKEDSPRGQKMSQVVSNREKLQVHENNLKYNGTLENEPFTQNSSLTLNEYKKTATVIVEEYFTNDDVISTANEFKDLGMPDYDYYFVKKLVSMAMDRRDKEKEMAAVLLSSLYADVINPRQLYKGFSKLVESVDDLVVDIPDAVDVLALFIARAIVDDILPPVFLTKQMADISTESKGADVIRRADKVYLSIPYHTEVIENKWGGSKNKTVEGIKAKIVNLLAEYVVSGDKKEACRCIKELNVPYFHHEIMKRALIMAMERRKSEGKILDLLRMAAEEGLINSSQITKGFNRMIDTIDDLCLDIPNGRQILQGLISRSASQGWLSASSLKSLNLENKKRTVDDNLKKRFKVKAENIIQEYFVSGDIVEVCSCLENEYENQNATSASELNAIFVKRLINLAMDRKNREKEMASVLLSSLGLKADDVANGFAMLIESADDTALDNPLVVEDLAKFVARAIVDEVIAPSQLEDIGDEFEGCDSTGKNVIQMAKSLLKARLSGERILRCWGGERRERNGWAIEDVKDKIRKLLEEFECGGDVREAFRCIKELGMPFFHHEVVKKTVVMIIEKRNDRMWHLLKECFNSGLLTVYQITKGFGRVEESLDDLCLDVPDAKLQFSHCVQKARTLGWIDPSFSSTESS